MDMAPRHAGLAADDAPAEAGGPSARARDALAGATQAAIMMALVWPVIAAMPFFWAPPFWVMAGITGGPRPPEPQLGSSDPDEVLVRQGSAGKLREPPADRE